MNQSHLGSPLNFVIIDWVLIARQL
jgi:hypothetical protein